MRLSVGSLCAGYGGLDLGLSMVLPTELAWVAEVDPHASWVLEARFGVPNLGDLTAVDWTTVPRVDVVTAGYPCQPFSHAGRREGANDERHLWPHIALAIRALRPRLVVLENVDAHLSLGFDTVLADLAALGFDAEWCLVRASDVGAAHRRARLFVLASHPDQPRLEGTEPTQRHVLPSGRAGAPTDGEDLRHERHGGAWGRRTGPADGGIPAPDARGQRRNGRAAVEGPRRDEAERGQEGDHPGHGGRPSAPHADLLRLQGERREPEHDGDARDDVDRRDGARLPTDWGAYGPAIARHAAVIGRDAPDPVDGRGRLSPRFVEWLMMVPDGWVTDIVDSRTASLRILGNGVVPLQAAYALGHLFARLAEREAVSA